ncbi:MnhB domain-containing protein [Desulfospira joergensenii]|uniref:MnhB domain-containing protein n=1 Tax=Desulfospira joergensenii TaxID=53329 RepID=UPI000410630F|nr:MnhB domain-containing protein [Desulfospira joergensenii]
MKSVIFRTTAHIVIGIMLLFSLYLLFRGHNEPGGGFIGALIAVIALAVLVLAESGEYVRQRIRFSPELIAVTGVGISLTSGLLALFRDQAFLTGIWWKTILPLGTPLLFDIGVYLAVTGAVLSILLHLVEELS